VRVNWPRDVPLTQTLSRRERERRRDGEMERKQAGICSLSPSIPPSLCPSLSERGGEGDGMRGGQ
jgi:hypothetical protein